MSNVNLISSYVNRHLLSSLDHGVIHNDRVFDAMLATDRGIYSRDYPYADSPQSIGTQSNYIFKTHALIKPPT